MNDRLPDDYEARINERLELVDEGKEHVRVFVPDVSVVSREGTTKVMSGPADTAGVATLEPVKLALVRLEEETTTYLEIRERSGDRKVVTVLELLSPANKSGKDRAVYPVKRMEYFRQGVHLFELDLLLGGNRLPAYGDIPPGHYYAFLARAERWPEGEVYAWPIDRLLPVLPVPLRSPDPDILIDYQALFTTTYDRGRYSRSLDYASQPSPALGEVERAWTRARIEKIGKPR